MFLFLIFFSLGLHLLQEMLEDVPEALHPGLLLIRVKYIFVVSRFTADV